MFANPDVPHGLVDKAAYSFCVLEHLHRSLRRRDVFAKDGDCWGDPRAELLAGGTGSGAVEGTGCGTVEVGATVGVE
ncbi:hypothetical protein ME763_07925 [Streptomyces murinus]|uniref:hypothetical protein n=1 Tax=Streptomyces murinus TaxID=33900 RepID=UPI000A1D7AF9|nr:hypothetical protein [Streptomyces murinus]WDO05590.1 hypothetical protein ME763_07925 [Streptomyces murinus]